MSKENLDKFKEDLKSDLSLKNRLDDLIKRNSDLSESDKKEKIVEFANNEGYDFDISDFDNTTSEIGDDELFNVAGGRNGTCWSLGSQCTFLLT